jgi:hypothetical protein
MEREYELDIRPFAREEFNPDKPSVSSHRTENRLQPEPSAEGAAERPKSIVAFDGKTRSKWRLFAIVTALFVCKKLVSPYFE